MNMFQLQERIKDFSKDQLVREMQQPSGAVPPFLVLSELQRRTRMEQAFNAEQAKQGQQTTVAQEAVAAAGVPQGGIADMARAMAPQTDMTGNTGVAGMAPQAPVERMQVGGEVEGPNTARLRQIMDIQRTLSEMQANTGIMTERARRRNEARSQQPSLAEVPAAVVPAAAVNPSEFGGLPDFMVEQAGAVPMPQPGEGYFPQPAVDFSQGVDNTLGDLVAIPQRVIGSAIEGVGSLAGSEGISDYGRSVSASGNRLAEEGFVAGGGQAGPQDLGELGFSAMQALGFGEALARSGVKDPAEVREAARAELEVQAKPIMPLTPDAETPRPVLRPDREATPPGGPRTPPPGGPRTSNTGGGAGGAGGGAGGAGRGLGTDRMFEQDKWLALAQFGLGLMGSQQPTLGGAIGEAGTAALGQLSQARQAAVERDLAERTLAARTAGGSEREGLSSSNLISVRADMIEQLNTLTDGLAGEPTAADVEAATRIRNQIVGIDRLLGLDTIGGLGAVSPELIPTPSATR